MIHQPEVKHPENVDLEFSEGHTERDIETNYPNQNEVIKKEYNRPTDKHFKDNPKSKRQVNISKVIHKFLPKQTEFNEIIKLIERKILKGTQLPMTII